MTSTAGTDAPSTRSLVARYASTFNARHATAHGVTSPLGAWLLLALASPLTSGDERRRLEGALGCSADDAARRADALLRASHPAVSCAAAMWWRAQFLTDAFHDAVASVSGRVERGPVPSQVEADRWASALTHGMIESFPLSIDDLTALVLATAVATDVSWSEPFETSAGAELGGSFGGAITTALHAVMGHRQVLASTSAAGVVAVHVASARSGLDVVSVLAGADVEPAAVHDAAHEVAAMLAGDSCDGQVTATKVSLFDLPLGEGPAWTLTETTEVRMGGSTQVETFDTVLPAWSARSRHDVLSDAGFDDLCTALAAHLRTEVGPPTFAAVQAVVASCTRTGFTAAAVTAVGMRAAGMPQRVEVVRRHADVRFNRPYAVVAVATDRTIDDRGRFRRADVGEWSGVPVFSAWVAQPDDTSP